MIAIRQLQFATFNWRFNNKSQSIHEVIINQFPKWYAQINGNWTRHNTVDILVCTCKNPNKQGLQLAIQQDHAASYPVVLTSSGEVQLWRVINLHVESMLDSRSYR